MLIKRCLALQILLIESVFSFNFSFFKISVPTSDYVKNEKCKIHSNFYLKRLNNGATWAVKMFDSSTKFPNGLLYGSSFDLGNFDECLQVKTKINNEEVTGKYCLPSLEVLRTESKDKVKNDEIEEENFWEYISILSKNPQRRPRNIIRWAVCMPSTCKEENLENHLINVFKNFETDEIKFKIKVSPGACQTKDETKFDKIDFIFIFTVVAIVFTVLFSTIYEILGLNIIPSHSDIIKMIKCFSIASNYKKLVTHYPDENNLECIHGMRVTSTLITVIFHLIVTIFGSAVHNLQELEEVYNNGFARTLLNVHSMIDIFFIITAFLTSFLLLDDLHKNRPFSYVRFIVHRLVRCSPLYILTIFFYATVFIKMGDGPLWRERINIERESCVNNWWINLLYINNYVNTQSICVIQSWFLSASMQMFFVTPFVVICLYRNPKVVSTILVLFIILFAGISFLQVYYTDLEPIVLFNPNILEKLTSKSFRYGYIPTHTRASAYIMGILTAYIRYKIKTKEMKIPKFMLPFGWYLSTFCTIITLYVGNSYYIRKPFSQLESAAFASLYHILIGYAMCWTILATSTGNGKIMQSFFAKKWLIPYSKITYSVNMCNFSIFYYLAASSRVPFYIDTQYMMWNLISNVVLTYTIGFILYLFFEAPFINLDRFLFRSGNVKEYGKPQDIKTDKKFN